MQAFVCNSDGIPMSDTLLTIQVAGSVSARNAGRSCLSPVELGKRLLVYSRDGDTDEVRNLISRGAPFTTDWLGTSPLHLAAQMGHTETAEVLLRGGISRDARTKVDRTPLHIAAQEGHTSIVELLLSHGADVDASDMLRMTPLHWAVERGHTDTVIKLLEHGANPNSVSKFDKTPMLIAIDHNRVDLLDVLQNNAIYNMQKDNEDAAHFMSQLEEADSAAENLVVELGNEPSLASQEEEVQTSHGNVQNAFESKSQSIKINFLNSSDKAKAKKTTVLPGASTSTAQTNIQFLRAHGITMIPADDSSLVASAMESGQTVVLTEAGKLALNLTRGPGAANKKVMATTSPGKLQQRKVVTISAEQLAALTGKVNKMVPPGKKMGVTSNIMIRTVVSASDAAANAPRVITTTTGKRVFPSSAGVQVVKNAMTTRSVPGASLEELADKSGAEEEESSRLSSDEVKSDEESVARNEAACESEIAEINKNKDTDSQEGQFVKLIDRSENEDEEGEGEEEEEICSDASPVDDLESMSKKLAQAKKEAEEYRKQLLQKEQEAEVYMKKLQSLTK